MHLGSFLSLVGRQVKEFFGRLSRGQIIRLAVLVVLVIAIAVVASLLFGREEYTMIYANSDAAARSAVYNSIKESGTPVKFDGDAILVPTAQAEIVRMDLASKDLLGSGGNDISIAKEGMGMGSNNNDAKTMEKYQIEENVRRTLMAMTPIVNARVMITMPETSVFVLERQNSKPTASVLLELRDGGKLKKPEVLAVAKVVAAAVKDLKPEDVIISDTSPHLYSLTDDDEEEGNDVAQHFDMEDRVRDRLEAQVHKLLTPIFGPDRVSVAVSVGLNFDTKQQESTVFAPPVPEAGNNGIIISMKELYERINGEDTAAGQPGQDINGGLPVYPYTEGTADDDPYSHYEREVNMEVNQVKTMVESAKGRIERLSVAVIIDREENGEDYTKMVQSLVANAIGITEKSSVTVSRLPYKEADTSLLEAEAKQRADAQRNELIKLGIIVAAALVVCIMLIALLRDIFKPKHQTVTVPPPSEADGAYDLPEDAVEGVDYVIDEDGNVVPIAQDVPHFEVERKRNEKQEFIEKLIDEDPEIAAQLLRSWLIDE